LSFESNNPELTMALASRRVLVTGGCGFVGSHLVRRLVQMGSRVTSLGGNPNEAQQLDGARYIFGDISRDTLQSVGFVPDTIFHLAGGASVAASMADPPADFLITVFSSVLLLDFLRTYWSQSQLVYVSSAAIYGEAEHKKASHDLSCLPISPYGVHKKQVESLLLDHARMYQTRSVIVRPFSVYGPGLRKQLLWDAMQKASRSCFEFFYNAGTCRAVSVRDVLAELFRAAGIDREPAFLGMRKEGDPDRLVADDSAEGLLGPLFLTPLSEGLLAYVNWYFQRGSHV
jgi:UDP-glucose 4-epimerase